MSTLFVAASCSTPASNEASKPKGTALNTATVTLPTGTAQGTFTVNATVPLTATGKIDKKTLRAAWNGHLS